MSAGAAAVQLAVALDHREGIGVPGLAGHRHHVGVAGQADAADAARADGGEQAGLEAVGRRHALALDAEALEVALDEADQRQVALAAGRVEGDEAGQQLLRRAYAGLDPVSIRRASVQAAPGVRAVEREGRDRHVEQLARLRRHLIAADHDARRRLQRDSPTYSGTRCRAGSPASGPPRPARAPPRCGRRASVMRQWRERSCTVSLPSLAISMV